MNTEVCYPDPTFRTKASASVSSRIPLWKLLSLEKSCLSPSHTLTRRQPTFDGWCSAGGSRYKSCSPCVKVPTLKGQLHYNLNSPSVFLYSSPLIGIILENIPHSPPACKSQSLKVCFPGNQPNTDPRKVATCSSSHCYLIREWGLGLR